MSIRIQQTYILLNTRLLTVKVGLFNRSQILTDFSIRICAFSKELKKIIMHLKPFTGSREVPHINLGPIGSAVLTVIG